MWPTGRSVPDGFGCDKGFSETAIYADHFAFHPQFGAFFLEDQFDPQPSLVHPQTNGRAHLPAVSPKAIHMGGLVDRNRDLRHSRSEAHANGVVKKNSTGKNLLRISYAALKTRDSLANRLTGDHH